MAAAWALVGCGGNGGTVYNIHDYTIQILDVYTGQLSASLGKQQQQSIVVNPSK
jgi:hypothetical protein